jgi:endonuclease G, mitochondrial
MILEGQVKNVLIILSLLFLSATAYSEVLELNYDGFKVWLDCDKHGAVKFSYNIDKDYSNLRRYGTFYKDTSVPARCRQNSTKSYKHRPERYDRGHLVPANHLDHLPLGIKQSNFMTNILPQAANMNRGAWLLTEEIIECYRDKGPLKVIGGVIWGNDDSDDYFTTSHGVKTPDAFWKVVIGKERAIGWIVPNSKEAKRKKLDSYIEKIKVIEDRTGVTIPVPEEWKDTKPAKSWVKPGNCDPS